LAGDHALFNLDIDADLSVLWNWNVKQIFAWVQAEHIDEKNRLHQEVLWDRIIQRKDHANLNITNERAEYPLIDVERNLRNLHFNVTLRWDIMPTVGMLKQGGGLAHNHHEVVLPGKYVV